MHPTPEITPTRRQPDITSLRIPYRRDLDDYCGDCQHVKNCPIRSNLTYQDLEEDCPYSDTPITNTDLN